MITKSQLLTLVYIESQIEVSEINTLIRGVLLKI
ncbi:unnamed protein product [Paramecium sonneborni]|uniref:Uncharacterized protein n=1 Tax=Paramecium sonneborni TaxID=65129 RepID=A0A8S1R910_9CILI|nr:unnamed protein product [Paramecium sonneborni]